MCQAYTVSGDMIGNNHGSSTHKATVRGQHLPVAQTPSHIPISISHSIIANFCKAIYAFFHFSLREDSMPNILQPLTEMPFCLWPKVVQIYVCRDESCVRSYGPSYWEATE